MERIQEIKEESTFPTFQDVAQATLIDSYRTTPRHFLDLQIFGRRYPSMLDSGAVVSLLPSEIWKELPYENKESVAICHPGNKPLLGLGGSFPVDSIVDLPVIVEGRALVQRFFVSPTPTSPILGMDALTNLGIQIDFPSGEVFFAGDPSPLEQSPPLGASQLCQTEPKILSEPSQDLPFLLREGGTQQEREQVQDLFLSIPEIWKDPRFGKCRTTLHHIDTGTATLIRSRVRRLPPEKVKEVKHQIQTLLEAGAIRPSDSPWASPIVLVPKANGTTRLCVDYRALNEEGKLSCTFPLCPHTTDPICQYDKSPCNKPPDYLKRSLLKT